MRLLPAPDLSCVPHGSQAFGVPLHEKGSQRPTGVGLPCTAPGVEGEGQEPSLAHGDLATGRQRWTETGESPGGVSRASPFPPESLVAALHPLQRPLPRE